MAAEPLQVQQLTDLILLHPDGQGAPNGSEAWVEAMRPARLFHLRDGHNGDADRLARVLTGQSVGLVLSGGGARAYAHVGAVKALHERGVPIDFVGGVSMGAIIGAGVAMGWDDAELEMRIRRAFVESSPLDDIAFPMIALTHGDKVRERLTEHFGDRRIPDLWLPFFCLSANLTTGAYQLHRTGAGAQQALRASISLPVRAAPVTIDKNVLVVATVLEELPRRPDARHPAGSDRRHGRRTRSQAAQGSRRHRAPALPLALADLGRLALTGPPGIVSGA